MVEAMVHTRILYPNAHSRPHPVGDHQDPRLGGPKTWRVLIAYRGPTALVPTRGYHTPPPCRQQSLGSRFSGRRSLRQAGLSSLRRNELLRRNEFVFSLRGLRRIYG